MTDQENPYRSPDGPLECNIEPSSGHRLVQRGRLIFIAIAIFLLALEIAVPAVTAKDPSPVRIGLSVILLFFAWRGQGWAIALLAIGFGLGAVFSLVFFLQTLATEPHPVSLLLFLGSGVVSAAVVFVLIRSQSLNSFFKSQAARRAE